MARPTLRQVFLASLAGTALLLGLLFSLLFASSRRSLLGGAEALREAAARRAAAGVESYLRQAETPLRDVEADLRNGVLSGDDARAVERRLLSAALASASLAEVTFTHARPGWQVSLTREGAGDGALIARHTRLVGGQWRLALRQAPPGRPLLQGALADTPLPAFDPTSHLTYTTPAGPAYGRAVWTDLHYTELDEALPVAQRRVVVTVMKTMEDEAGRFVGVMRAGVRADQLDTATHFRVDERLADDPHRVFVADGQGRLVTRLSPQDRLQEFGDDVRVQAAALPVEVALALTRPEVEAVTSEHPSASAAFEAGGRRYLVTFRLLEGTQDWRVAVLVPEAHYTAALAADRNRLLLAALGLMVLLVAAGALLLRSVQRGLGQVVRATARMEDFDFQPAATSSPFRDLQEVQQRLERAKTALRAMGLYVPIDLVRLLYASGREPALGGELREVSLMFTDVMDFTTLAEGLSPDELGALLGRYLAAMTGAVHATGGTVDKYIGDAVMAFWNAPLALDGDARRACQAALGCQRAAAALFASPEWGSRPPLVTRFGLHRDTVTIGHFGAPDRMSYTAMGDGVNLAARLEGLNKHYGTTILASDTIRGQAGESFRFRLVDVVAVKGRRAGVRIHELIGGPHPSAERVAAYESAFARYQGGAFAEAARALDALDHDGPSACLRARCRALAASPPPAGWDGVYTWDVK
jgi:adenylate cyclase